MKDIIEIIKIEEIGRVEENVPLKKCTTYKAGGIARCIVYPTNSRNLVKLLGLLKENKIVFKILGNGSNLLFSDQNYDGILIKLSEFNDIKFMARNKVRAGAGVSLIKLSLMTAKKGLTGLEFASGIPGTVGGAVFMNAGAYKSDMGYIVQRVKVLTPELKIINLENKEMDFHYRSSFLQKHKGEKLLFVYAGWMEIVITPDGKCVNPQGNDLSEYGLDSLGNPYDYFYNEAATYTP